MLNVLITIGVLSNLRKFFIENLLYHFIYSQKCNEEKYILKDFLGLKYNLKNNNAIQ